MTIAVQIDAPSSVSGRRALFATSDPTKVANTDAEGKNSRYVAYGLNGKDVGYLASWRGGDRFTGGSVVTENAVNMMIVYVISPKGNTNTFKTYVNGNLVTKVSYENSNPDGFMSGYEIATPKMVKEDHASAKIYIGGGKHSAGDGEVFNGRIKNVRVYSGVLSAEEVAAIKPFYDVDQVKDLLGAAIEKAEARFETIADEIGNGLCKYTVNPNFEAELKAIKDFYNSIGSTTNPEEIVAKTEQVESLIASIQLNMPQTGKFYRLKNNASGWYATSDLRADETEYSNKLYMKEDGTIASTIWYLTADKKLLSYTIGQYLGDMSSDWSFENVGSVGNVVNFYESNVVGKYQISPSSGRALYGDKVRVDGAGIANNSGNYAWIPEEVTSLPVAIGATGYATFYSPVAVILPEGLEAYYVSDKTQTSATLTQIKNVIPAETAVILKGTAEQTYNLTIGGTADDVENLLSGTVASTYVAEDAYVLSAPDGKVGLYMATKNQDNNTKWLNNGFKAYLPAPTDAARFISFDFGTETAIDELNGENGNEKTVIYDLSGRRVQGAQKGIFIVNGKKVVK